ncbi:MAG: flavodoxin [Candidatus Bathyarchaeota archaeon]|nr:flavodoxin [Candidatus Bathyarchaeota archaeon]
MRVLNLFYTSTKNTEKVARQIHDVIEELGYSIDTVNVTSHKQDIDILQYNMIFVGSGVYGQLPGQPLIDLHRRLLQQYNEAREVKPASPRRPSTYTVIYCTYGGVHTGINEAIPAVKFLGQLYDHLGYSIVGEWYVVGEYLTENLRNRSVDGRLGDIRGRPNEQDLREVKEKVLGLFKSLPIAN